MATNMATQLSSVPAGVTVPRVTDRAHLQRQVKDHLLLNFTDMSEFADSDVRVFVRGDGCYVIDADGRRAIDGHLRAVLLEPRATATARRSAAAAHEQLVDAGLHPVLVHHQPGRGGTGRAAQRRRPARSALNRVFLTSGGGEANEAMYKLARQYHAANGQPQRRKAISRRLAYHGTSLGRAVAHRPAVLQDDVRAAADPDRVREQHQRLPAPARPRRGGVHRRAARRDRGRDRVGGPRDRRPADRRAGAELRRLVHPARAATGRGCARSATSTASCWSPTRSSPASAGSATGSRRCATRPARTW